MRNGIDLSKLEAMAMRASPGPWVEDDGNVFSVPIARSRHNIIMRRLNGKTSRIQMPMVRV